MNISKFNYSNQKNIELCLNSKKEMKNYSLNEKELQKIIKTSLNIEKILGFPQDIEAVFSKNKLYIIQSRNIVFN